MGRINIVQLETLVAGGGVITITSVNGVSLLKLSGTVTLTGSYNIVSSGIFSVGDIVRVFYEGVLDFNGNPFTILGKSIPDYLSDKKFVVEAFFDGASFNGYILVDPSIPAIISGDSLVDDTLDGGKLLDASTSYVKMTPLSEGEWIIGGPTATPLIYTGKIPGKIPVGDGTTVSPQSMTGHVVMDGTGDTVIQPGVIEESMLNFGIGGDLRSLDVTLSQSQLLNLNSFPLEILSDDAIAPGNMVALVSATFSYTFDSAQLNLSGNFELQHNEGGSILLVQQADIEAVVNRTWVIPLTSQVDIVIGRGIRIAALVADPTGGGAATTLRVKIYYIESTV